MNNTIEREAKKATDRMFRKQAEVAVSSAHALYITAFGNSGFIKRLESEIEHAKEFARDRS